MRVIVAGSRTFFNYDMLKKYLDIINEKGYITEIVSGTAKGADSLGERWAEENNIPIKYFKPDWDRLGKRAGPLRNIDMADYADMAIVFMVKGGSKGSQHMYDTMKKMNKLAKIYEDK